MKKVLVLFLLICTFTCTCYANTLTNEIDCAQYIEICEDEDCFVKH